METEKTGQTFVQINKCSEALYILCFEPANCALEEGSPWRRKLEMVCDNVSFNTHRAMQCDLRLLHDGMVIVLRNTRRAEQGVFPVDYYLSEIIEALKNSAL